MPLSQLLPESAEAMPDSTPILPAHIEETIQAIARLHAEHRRSAKPLQLAVERLTAAIGRPLFAALLTLVCLAWMAVNVFAEPLHLPVWDPAPFFWLQGATTLLALYISIFILTTQRRENELSELRAQLSLELVITNERKTAKIVQLLEELRRDLPEAPDRHDPEAEVMAKPADPQTVLDALKETQEIEDPAVETPRPPPSA